MRKTKKKLESHPIDILAGERVREIRLLKGMTQGKLAEKIGVTFQQIQKYESAINRMSASKLYLFCEALETTIPELFTELYSRRRKTSRVMKMLESAEAVKLARLFFKMSHGKRQHFYEFGKSLVETKRGSEGNAKITDKPNVTPQSHPVDVYVGKRIWQIRTITNMTQRQLAGKIDVQHQQIQKYEEAINRVSVSKLYLICEALEMSLPEFFADLYEKRKKKGIMKMIDSEEGTKLAGVLFRMSPSNRKHFIDLGKEFVES